MVVWHRFLSKRKGFLLIELLIALAILSGLALVVSSQIWQTIKIHKEAELRLLALNGAISELDRLVGKKRFMPTSRRTDLGATISIDHAPVQIDQKKIDRTIKPNSMQLPGQDVALCVPVVAKVEWENCSGKKETLRLVTAILLDGAST